MIRRISCKVIESNPLSEEKRRLLCLRNQNASSQNQVIHSLKGTAKLYYDDDGTRHSFNCRL